MRPAPIAATGLVPDAPTQVMIASLAAVGTARAPLVVGEASGALAAALREAGATPWEWLRQAVAGRAAPVSSWPTAGTADAALVRLPKAKDALDMALHAVASRTPPGALLIVLGANDEGIRSASRHLATVADDVATIAVRQHARIIGGQRKAVIDGLRASLSDWRREGSLALGSITRRWISYPGVFAGGGLDAGTALLLTHLPEIGAGARVLDFAAGTGVIGAAVLEAEPAAVVDLLEPDAVALAAAAENVPAARAFLGAGLAAAGAGYDLILSNPPIHDGVRETRAIVDRLVAEAPARLVPGGELRLVIQRRVAVLATLEAAFGNARLIADDGRFTVVAARREGQAARAPSGARGRR
jgi:16S rRNA (guanine1207-N2)-methyltransferase